jgi:PHP family Zn ribbon phosphoesterase
MDRRSLGPMAQGQVLARCSRCARNYSASQMAKINDRNVCPVCVAEEAQGIVQRAPIWQPQPVEGSKDV